EFRRVLFRSGALPSPDARRRAGRSKPRGSSLPAGCPVRPVLKNNVITLPELLLDLIGPSKILSLSSFFPFVYLPFDLSLFLNQRSWRPCCANSLFRAPSLRLR